MGWVPVGEGPNDRWHREGFVNSVASAGEAGLLPGTYELCGPKVQDNPENLEDHRLIPHGKEILGDAPRTYDALKEYLDGGGMGGIVWHHPDGRMVKIKAKEFGVNR